MYEKTKNNTQNQDLIPISKWNDFYAYPTVGALRQLVFYDRNNFCNKVVRRIGKRMYIKVSAFNEWVESNQGVA